MERKKQKQLYDNEDTVAVKRRWQKLSKMKEGVEENQRKPASDEDNKENRKKKH